MHTHASVQRGADGSASLVLAVTDAGRGMTQQEAAACFTAGQAAAPDFGGGTGLGLYSASAAPLALRFRHLCSRVPCLTVSNAFARLMGGSLTVQSEPGKGSTFELRVPIRILPPEEAAEAAEAASEVMTGEAAAAAAAAAAVAAAEAQRSRTVSASTAAAAPVVAASRVAAPCSPPATPTRHRFHVLIADDHQLNLRLFTRLLQMHDFVVTAVGDGGAALAALQASFAPPPPPGAAAAQAAQPPPFDVAVLDMDMPVLRGTQVAAAFRTFEAGVHLSASMRLPIFALTANVLEEHAAECIQAGCVALAVSCVCVVRSCDENLLTRFVHFTGWTRSWRSLFAQLMWRCCARTQRRTRSIARSRRKLRPPLSRSRLTRRRRRLKRRRCARPRRTPCWVCMLWPNSSGATRRRRGAARLL